MLYSLVFEVYFFIHFYSLILYLVDLYLCLKPDAFFPSFSFLNLPLLAPSPQTPHPLCPSLVPWYQVCRSPGVGYRVPSPWFSVVWCVVWCRVE